MAGILIISPHADDETLGCGGTILKFPGKYHWLLCAYEDKPYKAVEEYYRFASVDSLMLPDGKFDTCDYGLIVYAISKYLEQIKPKTILIPYLHDVHSDHRIIASASLAAAKPFRSHVKRIWMYEVMSQTNLSTIPFCPNMFVDITQQMPGKLRAVELYGNEMIAGARSGKEVEALAVYRGASINVSHAEGYMAVRDVY